MVERDGRMQGGDAETRALVVECVDVKCDGNLQIGGMWEGRSGRGRAKGTDLTIIADMT